MLEAIEQARHSIQLEMYIIQPGAHGEKFRDALAAAAQRGLRVQVLADAFGSMFLTPDFWRPLQAAGAEFRFFNLPGNGRFGLRDHRKLMVCDEATAFIGGLNIGPEYAGDGVKSGWRDLGLRFHGTLARELGRAFDEMFELAEFRHPRFAWMRHAIRQRQLDADAVTLLLAAPGWRRNPLVRTLVGDFKSAATIRILCAYFLPTGRVMRALRRAPKRGARVQLILAGHSDIKLMQMATRSLYRRLLKAGVEIYEYQPQVLHAKLIIINRNVAYAGSANLDVRSLHLNYELLLRVENERLAHEALEIFDGDLAHCRRVELAAWVKTRHWWRRWLDNFAYFLLARLDPFIASRSWRR
jgi:cardiolipin synthase